MPLAVIGRIRQYRTYLWPAVLAVTVNVEACRWFSKHGHSVSTRTCLLAGLLLQRIKAYEEDREGRAVVEQRLPLDDDAEFGRRVDLFRTNTAGHSE